MSSLNFLIVLKWKIQGYQEDDPDGYKGCPKFPLVETNTWERFQATCFGFKCQVVKFGGWGAVPGSIYRQERSGYCQIWYKEQKSWIWSVLSFCVLQPQEAVAKWSLMHRTVVCLAKTVLSAAGGEPQPRCTPRTEQAGRLRPVTGSQAGFWGCSLDASAGPCFHRGTGQSK